MTKRMIILALMALTVCMMTACPYNFGTSSASPSPKTFHMLFTGDDNLIEVDQGENFSLLAIVDREQHPQGILVAFKIGKRAVSIARVAEKPKADDITIDVKSFEEPGDYKFSLQIISAGKEFSTITGTVKVKKKESAAPAATSTPAATATPDASASATPTPAPTATPVPTPAPTATPNGSGNINIGGS